ncbi:hypothetical protein [Lentilactobacillus farraginis]|nr:hypothetical protein [Lentilactobacillus farraginis]GAF38036.1 hypothetical protein JCM14108_3136 [Lentilactobacillus farraginis DSM 18382 = JCM 14108]
MEKTIAPTSERINVQRDFIRKIEGTLNAKEVSRLDNRKFAQSSHYDYFTHAFGKLDEAKAKLLELGGTLNEK